MKHARKRRQHQLKAWENYERRIDKDLKKGQPVYSGAPVQQRIHGYPPGDTVNGSGVHKPRRVEFGETVTILEAASRNDFDEGT